MGREGKGGKGRGEKGKEGDFHFDYWHCLDVGYLTAMVLFFAIGSPRSK